jgi:hypothetical protein
MEFLLPETTVREAGAGPAIDIGEQQGGTLILTLGITRILEKESIEVAIWGSPDGTEWGAVPLAAYPQKCYCGTYQMHLDLATRPDVRFLRAEWDAGRWSVGKGKPLFTLYLFLQAPVRQMALAGVG